MLRASTTGRLTAILLAILIVLSTVTIIPVSGETTAAGTTSVSDVEAAPDLVLSNATINDSTNSQIQLAYNATGAIKTEDIRIKVTGPGYYASANSTQQDNINTTISDSEGVVNITIPAGTFGGGNITLNAYLFNESTGNPWVIKGNTLTVTSPVSFQGYSVSETTVVAGENLTVSTTLNNTANTSQEYTVAVYELYYGGRFQPTYKQVTLSPGEQRTISQNVSFSDTRTYNISVNDALRTEINVVKPVAVTNTTVSETAVSTFQNVTVNATIVNRGDQTEYRRVSLYEDGNAVDSRSVTLEPEESRNLSFVTYFERTDAYELRVNNGERKNVSVDQNPVKSIKTTVNTSSVEIGDTVRANVTLENTGSNTTERVVELRNGYWTVEANTVSPAGGEVVTTSFNHTFKMGGAHALTGQVYNGYQKILVSDPAVTIEGVSLPSPTVYRGDRTDITVTVNNTAEKEKYFKLSLWSNKSNYKTEQIAVLAAGEQKQVTIPTTFYQTGEHNLTVNDEPPQTLTVEEAVSVSDVSVSKRELAQNETFSVNITLENPTSSDRTKWVNLWTGSSQNSEVMVPAGETKTVSFEVSYSSPGRHTLFAAGQQKSVVVLNDTTGTANITLDRVFTPDTVVNNSTGYIFGEAVNTGNASGVQNVTLSINGTVVDSYLVYVDANSSAPVILEHEFGAKGEYTGTINASDSHPVNVTVRGPVVDDSSVTVEHVNGTEPSELPIVKPVLRGNGISVKVTASEYNRDLADIGADQSTVFRINFTVRNYTSRIMASTGQNLTWTTTSAGENRTNVSIRVSPSQLDFKTDFEGERPRSPAEWDSAVKNDTADFGYDAAILLSVGNAQGNFFDASPADLNGMTVSTDAQMFTMPRYYPGDNGEEPRLEIGLAAPHETVDGNVNDGHYRAFLPNALLDTWNVTDPESELTAAYSESDTNLTVTEVEGGAYVTLSLHYSSGTVTVSRAAKSSADSETTSETDDISDTDSTSDSDSTSDTDTSGTDTTTNYESENTATVTDTATPTATATETDTVTPTATSTEADTATPTASPTVTATSAATPTEESTETATPTAASTPTSSSTSQSAPGFGIVVAVLSLLGAAFSARSRV